MHRLGFKEHEIDELVENLKKYNVKVASILAIFLLQTYPKKMITRWSKFIHSKEFLLKFLKLLSYQPIRHILNTAGITHYSDYQFEMVRIGIGMVGISANPKVKKQLQSAVTFKTVISQISEVKQGDSIGYNRKYKAKKTPELLPFL